MIDPRPRGGGRHGRRTRLLSAVRRRQLVERHVDQLRPQLRAELVGQFDPSEYFANQFGRVDRRDSLGRDDAPETGQPDDVRVLAHEVDEADWGRAVDPRTSTCGPLGSFNLAVVRDGSGAVRTGPDAAESVAVASGRSRR